MKSVRQNKAQKKCKQRKKIKDENYTCSKSRIYDSPSFRKWTRSQNILYAQFLAENRMQFQDHEERRSAKFFSRMSESLQINKNNIQCQTHHQKMMKRYQTIDNIINQFLEPFVKIEYKKQEENNKNQVKTQECLPALNFTNDLNFNFVKKEEENIQ